MSLFRKLSMTVFNRAKDPQFLKRSLSKYPTPAQMATFAREMDKDVKFAIEGIRIFDQEVAKATAKRAAAKKILDKSVARLQMSKAAGAEQSFPGGILTKMSKKLLVKSAEVVVAQSKLIAYYTRAATRTRLDVMKGIEEAGKLAKSRGKDYP